MVLWVTQAQVWFLHGVSHAVIIRQDFGVCSYVRICARWLFNHVSVGSDGITGTVNQASLSFYVASPCGEPPYSTVVWVVKLVTGGWFPPGTVFQEVCRNCNPFYDQVSEVIHHLLNNIPLVTQLTQIHHKRGYTRCWTLGYMVHWQQHTLFI